MKKAGLVLTPLLLLIVSPVFADTIIKTGNVSSAVQVKTDVNSSTSNNSTNNVHTHIEIDNNGEKKVLDESGPGNYSLTSNSNGGETSVNVTTNTNENNKEDSSASASENKDKKDSNEEKSPEPKKTPAAMLINFFKDGFGFFLRIFRNL